MKLKLDKPRVPNFISSDLGNFSVADLEDAEIEEFIDLWVKTFRENREEKLKLKGVIPGVKVS